MFMKKPLSLAYLIIIYVTYKLQMSSGLVESSGDEIPSLMAVRTYSYPSMLSDGVTLGSELPQFLDVYSVLPPPPHRFPS